MHAFDHLCRVQTYVEALSNLVEGRDDATLHALTEIQFIALMRPISRGLEDVADALASELPLASGLVGATMPV